MNCSCERAVKEATKKLLEENEMLKKKIESLEEEIETKRWEDNSSFNCDL
jgi:cell division septum initiation protein DivIVA